MIINIQDIETKYINVAAHTDKNTNMQKLLANFTNFERLDATVAEDYTIALSVSHYRALSSMKAPCTILEDDCIYYDFQNTVEIPDDADILFLGVWKDIPRPFRSGKFVPAYEKSSDGLLKVYSMIGSHAIMYVSDKGRNIALKAYEMAIRAEIPNDIILSRALPFLNVYAFSKPIFAQTSMYEDSAVELSEQTGKDLPINLSKL
jgi:hypothetical protein